MDEQTEQGRAVLAETMAVRIETDAVGSAKDEKVITDALNAIEGVHEVNVAKGAIHVTYDPMQTSEKEIEESIRTHGSSVKSAVADTEKPHPEITGGAVESSET
jgi:copper chaperone CopZ